MSLLYQGAIRFFVHAPNALLSILFNLIYPLYKTLHTQRAWGRVEQHLKKTGLCTRTTPRAVFNSLYWNYIDSVRYLARAPHTCNHITYENEKLLTDTLAQGTPVVALSIHQGAFEMLHRSLCRYSSHVHLFTHAFPDKALTQSLRALRADPHLKEHNTKEVAAVIKAFFRDKGILALVIDQAQNAHGTLVTLLGKPATLYLKLPLRVNQMGAAIVTFRTFRTEKGHTIKFERLYAPHTEASLITLGISTEVNTWILEHPEQWTWNYHGNFVPPAT
jgi:lauroyl/myristoyl acyltransferase